jgi:hypothetical protein
MATKKAPKTVKGNGRKTATPPSTPTPTPVKAAKKKDTTAAVSPSKSLHYIRNLHNMAGGARFDLAMHDTRIDLRPRGERGDMRLVTQEMIDDPVYQFNKGLIFEEIPIDQGQEIIRKQAINQQSGPGVFDLLTNEYGKKYEQTRASVTLPFEQQGQVVASIDPGGDGRYTSGNVDINRRDVQPSDFFGNEQMGPQQVEVPGSAPVAPVFNPDVYPEGLSEEQQRIFAETPREQRQGLYAFWLQQSREAEQYRADLSVSVEPTEET